MKKFKSMLALLAASVLAVACSVPVFAADAEMSEPVSEEDVTCISGTSYEEIMDLDILLDMAVEMYQGTAYNLQRAPRLQDETEESYGIVVPQLLAKKNYSDGSAETEYVYNTIILADENGNPMTTESTIETINKTYEDSGRADCEVYGAQKVYTTERCEYDEFLDMSLSAKITKISSMAQSGLASDTCKEIFQEYSVTDGYSETSIYYRTKTVKSPTSGTWYTFLTGDTAFHGFIGGPQNQDLAARSYFTVNRNDEFCVEFIFSQVYNGV